MAFERRDGDERLIVAVNAGPEAGRLEIRLDPGGATALEPLVVAGGAPVAMVAPAGDLATLEIPGRSGGVLGVG
jgi:hypothetical protein